MGKKLEPWEECSDVWKTKAAFFNWMRGQMRRAWARHPVKVKFIRDNRFKAPLGKIVKATGRPKEVWAGKCACCGETFRTSDLQVDHIESAGSFKGWEDFEQWMHGLMHLSCADLQYLCKICHDIKSYAERHNISFDAARLEKEVIKFKKLDSHAQCKQLKLLNIEPAPNSKGRVEQYRTYVNSKEKDDEDTSTTTT